MTLGPLLFLSIRMIIRIESGAGDYVYSPPQPPGSLVIWGTEWPKLNRIIQRKCFLWTMPLNSLTWNEEHDIPSQILQIILDFMPQLFFHTPICVASFTFEFWFDPKL